MKKIVFLSIISVFLSPAFIFAYFDNNLNYGSVGQSVTELQEFLQAEGVYDGPITGNFYSLTLNGVKAFQARENISPVSGFFGPLTRARANDLLSASISQDENTPSAPTSNEDSTQKLLTSLLQQLAVLQQQMQQLQQQSVVSQEQLQEQQQINQQLTQIAQNTTPPPPPPPPPPIQGPTVTVLMSQSDFGSNGQPAQITGRKFIFMEVIGDWEKSKTEMWTPTNDLVIGTGYNGPYDRTQTGQIWPSSPNTIGHFYEVTNAPLGEYQWKVYVKKNEIENTEEGTFLLE